MNEKHSIIEGMDEMARDSHPGWRGPFFGGQDEGRNKTDGDQLPESDRGSKLPHQKYSSDAQDQEIQLVQKKQVQFGVMVCWARLVLGTFRKGVGMCEDGSVRQYMDVGIYNFVSHEHPHDND